MHANFHSSLILQVLIPLITLGVQVMELPVKYNFLLLLLTFPPWRQKFPSTTVTLKLLTVAITVSGKKKVMNPMFYAQFYCSTGLHLALVYF
jgi:hypothetical protein